VAPLVPGLEAEDLGPLTAADVTDLNPAPAAARTRQPILTNVPDARTAAQIAESQRIEEARQAKEAEMRMLDAKARGMPLIPDSPMGSRDILDWANENPIYLPPGFSEDRKLPEYESLKRNPLPNYWRQFVASAKQGGNPDSVAQRAFDAGLIPEPSADANFAAVQDGIAARKQYRVQFQARDKALAQEEKRVVDFEKSQTKLAKKPAAQEVPFDEIVPGDRMTIDGEKAVVKNVEYNEDGYLTNVVIEDGKRFGLMQFDAQNRGGILVDEFKPQPRQTVEDFATDAATATTTPPATSGATTPAPASRATSGQASGGQTIGETSGGALLDVAPSTRPRNRGETTAPQRADVLAELGAATREGQANQAQGRFDSIAAARRAASDRIMAQLQNGGIEMSAEEVAKASGLGTGLNPSGMTAGFLNVDIVNEAVDLVVRGVRDAAAWTAAMVQRFGEAIREFLDGLWQYAQAQVQSREVRFGGTTSRLRPSAEMGFVAAGANETQARFASPDAAQRVINGPRADVDVAAEASAWLDSLSNEAAVDAFASRAVPLPLDAAEFAAATLIKRLTMQGEQAKTEAGKLAAHVQAQRMARVWTKEYLSADPARALRQRGVVNNTILRPIAPVMAAQGILVDRADAVMNKRFEGGAGGVVAKVKAILEKADIDITERVEAILSAVMGSRLQPRVTLAQAVAGLVNGKTQRQQMIDDVARALMQRAKSREVKPGTQTALAALVASLKRTLGAAVKGEALKPETLKMGELLARTFVDQVAEAPLFEEAWKAGREQVRAMLIETGLSETQADKRLNELMPATPTVAYAPGMVKQAVQRGFEQAGYGQTLTTRMDRSGQRQVDVRAEALRNPQKAMEAVMKVWDEEADAAGISPEAWAQGRALAWKALGETMQQWQAQQQARQAKADAAAKAKLLEKDSPALAKLLKSLKDKIAPGMSWADIFMDMPSSQRERQREIYRRLMLDERLKDLTMEQRLDLTNELDRAWQRERKAVFNRELEKAGILGEKDKRDRDKVKKVLPKLLRLMNLGMLNSELFREVLAKEYGINQIDAAQGAELRKLGEQIQAAPEGLPRRKLEQRLVERLQELTGATKWQVLDSWWTASVLSGERTLVDIGLGIANGIEDVGLGSVVTALRTGNKDVALRALGSLFARVPSAFMEAMDHVFTGNKSMMRNFELEAKQALEGGNRLASDVGAEMWRKGGWRRVPGGFMIFFGRMLTALDHVNSASTREGAKAMALARHPDLYAKALRVLPADKLAARQQARTELTAGVAPTNRQQRLEEDARVREILEQIIPVEVLDEATAIGRQAALQGDPTGLGGGLLDAVNAAVGVVARKAEAMSKREGLDAKSQQVLTLLQGTAPLARAITGTKFARTLAQALNRNLSYVPVVGAYAVGQQGRTGAQGDILAAKQVIGALVGLALYLAFDDDDDEKGIEDGWKDKTPQQKAQLYAQGKQPFTVWGRDSKGRVVGFNYQQWGIAGIVNTVAAMLKQKNSEAWAVNVLMSSLVQGGMSFTDKAQLQGLQTVFGENSRSTDPASGLASNLNKWAAQTVGGLVPRLVKDIDMVVSPELRVSSDWWQKWTKEVPVVRQLSSGKRVDIFGEDIKLDRGPLSRVMQVGTLDPAYRLLAKLNERDVYLPDPSTGVRVVQLADGTRRSMTPVEKDRYQRLTGQGYRQFIEQQGADLLKLTNEDPERVRDLITKRTKSIRDRAAYQATH
jgi:hypothetical protein